MQSLSKEKDLQEDETWKQQNKRIMVQNDSEEKASLCSGLDFQHTKGVERLRIPSEMVSDGPHGLHKQGR